MTTLERRPDEQNTVLLLQPLTALTSINIKITKSADYRQTHTDTYQETYLQRRLRKSKVQSTFEVENESGRKIHGPRWSTTSF